MAGSSASTANRSSTLSFDISKIKTEIKEEPDDDLFVIYDSNTSRPDSNSSNPNFPVKVDMKCEMNSDLDTVIQLSEIQTKKDQHKDQTKERQKKPEKSVTAPSFPIRVDIKCEINEELNKIIQLSEIRTKEKQKTQKKSATAPTLPDEVDVKSEIDEMLDKIYQTTEEGQIIDEGVYYECNTCLMKFSSQFTLDTHTLVLHNKGIYRCDQCDLVCGSRNEYIHHRGSHYTRLNQSKTPKEMHPNASLKKWLVSYEKEFECDICFVKFEGVSVLAAHKLTHMPDLFYKCKLCRLKFKSKQYLDFHLKKHVHEQFKCPKCADVFQCKAHLRRHMIYHSSSRYYQCATCLFMFKKRADIIEHVQIHMEQGTSCAQGNQSS